MVELGSWEPMAIDAAVDRFRSAPFSENNLWCRPSVGSPWAIDVTVGDGSELEWIHRRDPAIRRPWEAVVLVDDRRVPYLAPELQLLFKSKDVRPKDQTDATVVIPLLEPERRSWLANRLPADHAWQTLVAGVRASIAIGTVTDRPATVDLLAAGRSSQAWIATTTEGDGRWIVRVPIPNSGRLDQYCAEVEIGRRLGAAGHPVSIWQLATVDDRDCVVGSHLGGSPVDDNASWTPAVVSQLAAVLRDLHRLPTTGWGPLSNRTDRLEGTSATVDDGVLDRWFHAPMWPFDRSDLHDHPVAVTSPDLIPELTERRRSILDAAGPPFGVVHSDLHREHILHANGELTGLLDFGDAFVGSTAWDFALLHWYHGADIAGRVAAAYGDGRAVSARGASLAVAVGCYKIAKAPDRIDLVSRLRKLLGETAT